MVYILLSPCGNLKLSSQNYFGDRSPRKNKLLLTEYLYKELRIVHWGPVSKFPTNYYHFMAVYIFKKNE